MIGMNPPIPLEVAIHFLRCVLPVRCRLVFLSATRREEGLGEKDYGIPPSSIALCGAVSSDTINAVPCLDLARNHLML